MAAISGGVLGFGSPSEYRTLLLQKIRGYGSTKTLVSICSYGNTNYSENQKKNGGGNKAVRRRKESQSTKWWLPIFGPSPDEKWAEEEDHSAGKPAENEEEEICAEKFVAGNFTAEKAKLLRKNLRSTASFRDLMYHSTIASRLASADSVSSEE